MRRSTHRQSTFNGMRCVRAGVLCTAWRLRRSISLFVIAVVMAYPHFCRLRHRQTPVDFRDGVRHAPPLCCGWEQKICHRTVPHPASALRLGARCRGRGRPSYGIEWTSTCAVPLSRFPRRHPKAGQLQPWRVLPAEYSTHPQTLPSALTTTLYPLHCLSAGDLAPY